MKKINTEALVGSLFVIGFDSIDPILYTYTLSSLFIDNQKIKMFEFEDKKLSSTFNKYVDFDGLFFKLKEGYTLDTNISTIEGYNWTLRNLFNKNIDLTKYLKNLDFSEIIAKRMELVGTENNVQFDTGFNNVNSRIKCKKSVNLNKKN